MSNEIRGIFSVLMQSRYYNRQLVKTDFKQLTLFIEEHNIKIIKIERLIKHNVKCLNLILFQFDHV